MKYKIKNIVAGILAAVLMITAIPFENLAIVNAEEKVTHADAWDTQYVTSNQFVKKSNATRMSRDSIATIAVHKPTVYNFIDMAVELATEENKNIFEGEESWPYTAIQVEALQAGMHSISIDIQTAGQGNRSKAIGMIIDGVMYQLTATNGSRQVLKADVYLTQGLHTVIVTMPMPNDYKTADNLAKGSWELYPWFDIYSYDVSEGLTISAAPSKTNVKDSVLNNYYNVVESDDAAYATYNQVSNIGYGETVIENTYSLKASDGNYTNTVSSTIKVIGSSGATINDAVTSDELKANSAKTYEEGINKDNTSWVQYAVEADGAGKYVIQLGAIVEGTNAGTEAPYGIVTVNGEKYPAEFKGNLNTYQTSTITVDLKKGINIIRCGGITSNQTCYSTAWIAYDYIKIPSKLSALNIVDGEETSLITNNYADKTKGNYILEDAAWAGRNNMATYKVAVDTLQVNAFCHLNDFCYIALKVDAEHAGNYNIALDIAPNGGSTTTNIGVIVNGKASGISFTKSWHTTVDFQVELNKGSNYLIFTTPIPTESSDSLVVGDYPYFNYNSIILGKGLTIASTTKDEIVSSLSTQIEAEDDTYATYSKYDNKEKDDSASGGYVMGGVSNAENKIATYDQIADYTDNNAQYPWIEYAVKAPADGEYPIRIKSYFGYNGSTDAYISVLVNGKQYKAYFDADLKWKFISNDLTVSLQEGTNYIRISSVTAEQTEVLKASKIWINHDCLEIPKVLTAVKVTDLPTATESIDAWNTNKVLIKNFGTVQEGEVGGANVNALRENRLSFETIMDNMHLLTYTAMNIKAEKDGYYNISVSAMTNSKTTSLYVPVIIDGTRLCKLKINATGSKQTYGAEIALKEGIHTVLFATPMPLTQAEADALGEQSDINKAYPWFNIYKFSLSQGIIALDNNATTISVMDTTKVSKNWSSYKDSNDEDKEADYLGAIVDDSKYDRVSLETVLESEVSRLPYISVTVSAEEDGYYDIFAKVLTKSSITSKYVAMIVDSKTVYPISVAKTGNKQDIGALIPLKKGTHTIAITSAMPSTKAEAERLEVGTNADGSEDWTAMNNAYPWFDFYSVTVSGRLSIVSGEENPLIDKSVLFAGDSITFSSKSWASKIGTWNHMDWKNAAIGGATVSTIKTRHIIHQLKANAANDYDYVIMNGGINDAMSEIEIGTVSESWNVADFDNTTYIGALETMFYYAYENFDGARIGYIITYATPNSNLGGYTQDMKAYYAEARKVCRKWNVPYIDLYEGTVTVDGKELSYSYDILQVDKNADIFLNNDKNEIHINDDGYKIITPYIEAWMMTIGENKNPLIEENRLKYIDAGDESKVLFNGFTANGGTLVDRVYTGMAEDDANIAILPYAKEMLGDWAYASIKVNAKEAGNYKLMVEMGANNATQMGMLVDGEVYTLNYSKQNGYCEFMEQTVYLTEGTHYITFTAAMPKEIVDVAGDAWNIYPWTNIFTIVVDGKLEVMNKPELSDITAFLGTVADLGQTVVNAGDETKVLSNYFKDEGDVLGSVDASAMRWDGVTLDVLTVDHLHYMPYAALKVNAEADGNYDILLDVETNKNAIADQIGLIIDGKETKVIPFKIAAETKIKATVYLTKGEHVLVFTSPMPETADEYETYMKEHGLKEGNGVTHPWINFKTIALGEGLAVKSVPTITEVENPHYNRIEAEDAKYALYTSYTSKPEEYAQASNGAVIGNASRKNITQTFEDISEWIDGSGGHLAYIEYAVIAPADGTYDVRAGIVADIDKSVVKNWRDIEKPFVAVIANNKAYKAQFTSDYGETQAIKVSVELKKGLNIIRCTSFTAEQDIVKEKAWINQDYVDFDKRLTAVERTSTVVEAETSKFYNLLSVSDGAEVEKASKGKILGNAQTIRPKSVGMTMQTFTLDQIRMVPYFSFTVTAPMDGYYSMSVNMVTDGRQPKSQIAMVVDSEISAVKYHRGGKSTADNRAVITTYLTKGDHVLTLTTPLPADATELANTIYSYRWMNFDYLTLNDGLKVAATQKAPTNIEDLVRIEAEDVGLPNMTKVQPAAEGKDKTAGYIGGAKYRRSQTVAQIKQEGLDGRSTPYVQYTVNAKNAGTYTVYFQASYALYNADIEKTNGTVAVQVNDEMTFQTFECEKKTTTNLIPVKMKLSKGNNIIRLTHFTGDSIVGQGFCWIDFDYIEIPAEDSKLITFVPTNGVVEAERSETVTYAAMTASGCSGGEVAGHGDYDYVDEHDVTFENLDINDLADLSRVTYTVFAEEAGTYNLALQFQGGVTRYTFNELVEKGTVSFAMSVNEGEKQLVEFCPDASGSIMNRIVEVDLQEGENKIMVTITLADSVIGKKPKIEDIYRLYWIDHDAIRLTAGVSGKTGDEEKSDVSDTDIDFAQLVARKAVANFEESGIGLLEVGVLAGSTAALLALFMFILILKKRKKEEEQQS